jgi:hypothetical protein
VNDDPRPGAAQGPQEAGILFFGPDVDAMFARVEPLLTTLPIGQNARVVVRDGKKESCGSRKRRDTATPSGSSTRVVTDAFRAATDTRTRSNQPSNTASTVRS